MQASQVLPQQTCSSMSLWTLLCALVRSYVGTGRGHSQTVSIKLGASKISWYAEAFRVPFTGTKGPSPASEKQPHNIIPPPPNFTLGTSTVLLATAKPRLINQIARWRSAIRHSREHVSFTALESSGGVLYTTASNALH